MKVIASSVLLVALATVGVIGSGMVSPSTLVFADDFPAPASTSLKPASASPSRIIIPSIDLNTSIVPMGINDKGELDVPSGSTKNVGWWQGGPVPGQMGSAVLDAHVFAAFSELHKTRPGDDIFVIASDGTQLRFTVQESKVFALQDLSSDTLFGSRGTKGLNLITCAGSFDSAKGTYTHRLVVISSLVEEM